MREPPQEWINGLNVNDFGRQALFELEKMNSDKGDFVQFKQNILSVCYRVWAMSSGVNFNLGAHYRELDKNCLTELKSILKMANKLSDFIDKNMRTPLFNHLDKKSNFDVYSYGLMTKEFIKSFSKHEDIKPEMTYRYSFGNLIYPQPIDTKSHNPRLMYSTLLCVNLVTLFRYWTNYQTPKGFIPVITKGGKPNYKLVAVFISAIFPDRIETAETIKERFRDMVKRNPGMVLSF